MQLNKRKRFMWCEEQLLNKDDFSNVIFTDESSIQLEQHSKICFRKRLQPRNLPKHPVNPFTAVDAIWRPGGITHLSITS